MKIAKKDVLDLYNLPREIKFCKKCVTSNQRPRIVFDKNGICNACNYADKKKNFDWKKKKENLEKLLDRYRRTDGYWDVICPGSGGKDSAFVAHKLKSEFGMNPLTVTWAPHIYTPIGWDNIQRFIHSGFDNIMGTSNGLIHRKMTAISFNILGEPFQPFIYGQTSFPLQIAVKYNIPLIMDGENAEIEYGGDIRQETASGLDLEGMLKYFWSGMGIEKWIKYKFTDKQLQFYRPPSIGEINELKVNHQFFSTYMRWIPQENYYHAAEHTGFQVNPAGRSEGTYSKYTSLDDKLDGFHYYLMFVKFGIGRTTTEACREIRDGQITREEGVQLVHRFDSEFPDKYYEVFLEYCNITEDEFWNVIDSWRSDHLWKKVKGKWVLKHQVT